MTVIWIRFRTHAQRSSHSEWQVRVRWCRYKGGTTGLTPSNQTEGSYHKPFLKYCWSFHLIQNRAEAQTAFNSAGPRLDWQLTGVLIVKVLNCRMVRKRSGALLKQELDNLSFLQSHPEVQRHFSNAGCMEFVERLQIGYHQATAEAFAKTFDGNKARVDSV